MTNGTTRSISAVAHALSTLVFLLALAFFFSAVSARVSRGITIGVVVFLLIAAGALLATYLVLSAAGALDGAVPLGRFVGDAWLSILASIVMVGVAWVPLSRIVAPNDLQTLFVSPVLLVTATGLMVERRYRLSVRRPLGATRPKAHLS
jgi:hypothetical protein